MTENITISLVALLVNAGIIGWVYKVMQSNIENQRVYFEREVRDLKEEIASQQRQIENLSTSESRLKQKYRIMYEHFRLHKECKHGGNCGAWDSYIEKVNNEEEV
jgi:uncharacterized membrane-anchored protein YhcB (DUF1043 family)